MVVSCVAYGCTYRFKKGSDVGMYRFPKDEKRRDLWVKAVKRRDWKPNACSRICGKHFQKGKPSLDKHHPDYVPNQFTFSKGKSTAHLYEKRKALLEKLEIQSERETAAEALLLLQEEPETESCRVEMHQDDQMVTEVEENSELHQLRNKVKSMDESIKCFEAEIKLLRAEKIVLSETVLSLKPTDAILTDPEKISLYTGLPSKEIFNWLKMQLRNETSEDFLSRDTQLLIVLMKLKLNLLSSDLACRFKISLRSVQRIFDTWIPLLGSKLKNLISWPNKKALKKYCPTAFKNSDFKNTVCIIDCTEVPIQRPNNPAARSQTWSNYKNTYTVKFLVGITPSGHICFLSETWGGRASDKEITLRSNFLNYISENDLILADRGFNLEEYFRDKGAMLVVPSYTRGKKQLSRQEVFHSKKVSNVRIHVERVIRQIKRYRILQTTVPISFLPYIESVILICAALSNMAPSIVT